MLRIKNNRICKGNVSFELPEGLVIDVTTDAVSQDGMVFVSPEENYTLVFDFEDGSITPYQSLISAKQEMGYPECGEIISIQRYGLDVCCCYYRSGNNEFYEEQFKTPITEDNNSRLTIYVESKNKMKDIDEILNLHEVKAFFDGITVE